VSDKIHFGPPFTFKDWQDFNQFIHGLNSGELGSGRSKPETEEDRSQDGSPGDARALFITGIALKQVAAKLLEGDALASAADQAIAEWEDDYCGTPPRPLPALALAAGGFRQHFAGGRLADCNPGGSWTHRPESFRRHPGNNRTTKSGQGRLRRQ